MKSNILKTIWLTIAILTLANITTANTCYQESANTSNQTGLDNCPKPFNLKYDGTYTYEGIWNTTTYLNDGDINTYDYSNETGTNPILYINYTMPYDSKPIRANYSLRGEGRWYNDSTIPTSCLSESILQLRLLSYKTYVHCWDGSWTQIGIQASNSKQIYEEHIVWEDDSDNFNRPDNEDVGYGWQENDGFFNITNNQLMSYDNDILQKYVDVENWGGMCIQYIQGSNVRILSALGDGTERYFNIQSGNITDMYSSEQTTIDNQEYVCLTNTHELYVGKNLQDMTKKIDLTTVSGDSNYQTIEYFDTDVIMDNYCAGTIQECVPTCKELGQCIADDFSRPNNDTVGGIWKEIEYEPDKSFIIIDGEKVRANASQDGYTWLDYYTGTTAFLPKPYYISYTINITTLDSSDITYVIFGVDARQSMKFGTAFVPDGTITQYGYGQIGNWTANQKYKIEYKNINYTTQKMDVYLDELEIINQADFYVTTDGINLAEFFLDDNGGNPPTVYFDDFVFSIYEEYTRPINGTNIEYCGGLINQSGTYKLNRDLIQNQAPYYYAPYGAVYSGIETTNTYACIGVDAPNVIIDCNGYEYNITSEAGGYGSIVAQVNKENNPSRTWYNNTNLTLQNCKANVDPTTYFSIVYPSSNANFGEGGIGTINVINVTSDATNSMFEEMYLMSGIGQSGEINIYNATQQYYNYLTGASKINITYATISNVDIYNQCDYGMCSTTQYYHNNNLTDNTTNLITGGYGNDTIDYLELKNNIIQEGKNIMQTFTVTNYDIDGNYWIGYSENCTDNNADSVCDNPYTRNGLTDNTPLRFTAGTPCTPNWTCDTYGACNSSNILPCTTVADLNTCGQTFNGTLSDYDDTCIYTTPTGMFVESDLAPSVVDNFTKILVGLASVAILIGMAGAVAIGARTFRGMKK